jgi:hypothetical protein
MSSLVETKAPLSADLTGLACDIRYNLDVGCHPTDAL